MENEHPDQRYLDLAEKWVKGTITQEELREYTDWLKQIDPSETLEIPAHIATSPQNHKEKIYQELQRRIHQHETPQKTIIAPRFLWWAAACFTMLVLGYSAYYFMGTEPIEKENQIVSVPATDIPAGTNGAVLTLANGKVIVLDTAANGTLDQKVMKSGEAIFFESSAAGQPVQYNTLTTPRARQQQLVLPDGSRIWLNAESSVKFPTAFTGKKREIEITGEAYFEISPDKTKPFVVKVQQSFVEVLGTHFNVMAYNAEAYLETTLLEGLVTFNSSQQQLILKPGQQSKLSANRTLQLVKDADVTTVMAWKNGLQSFRQKDMGAILRQIQRWYDVEVEYAGNIPSEITFTGDIPREVTLSQLLSALESKQVHFILDAPSRKLHVQFHTAAGN